MSKKKSVKGCEGCGGKCCQYMAVETETPRSIDAFEELAFYIYHGAKVVVQKDAGRRQWLLEFAGHCRHLTTAGRCRVYERRPKVCREHSVEDCEVQDGDGLMEMDSVEDLYTLMKKIGRGEWAKKLKARMGPST